MQLLEENAIYLNTTHFVILNCYYYLIRHFKTSKPILNFDGHDSSFLDAKLNCIFKRSQCE